MSQGTTKNVYYHIEEITLAPISEQKELCSPKDIVAHLNRNVIGQEQAKKQ